MAEQTAKPRPSSSGMSLAGSDDEDDQYPFWLDEIRPGQLIKYYSKSKMQSIVGIVENNNVRENGRIYFRTLDPANNQLRKFSVSARTVPMDENITGFELDSEVEYYATQFSSWVPGKIIAVEQEGRLLKVSYEVVKHSRKVATIKLPLMHTRIRRPEGGPDVLEKLDPPEEEEQIAVQGAVREFDAEQSFSWSSTEVADWIAGLDANFGHYATQFLESSISGEDLVDLSRDDLADMGIHYPMDQDTIIDALEDLNLGRRVTILVTFTHDWTWRREDETHFHTKAIELSTGTIIKFQLYNLHKDEYFLRDGEGQLIQGMIIVREIGHYTIQLFKKQGTARAVGKRCFKFTVA